MLVFPSSTERLLYDVSHVDVAARVVAMTQSDGLYYQAVSEGIGEGSWTLLSGPTAARSSDVANTTASSAKNSVVAVATTDQATLTGLEVTIDGVDLDTAGMRVALIGQTDAKENGIWLVQSGAWTRPIDFAVGSSAGGSYFRVMQGTLGAGKGYICSNYGSDVVGTNNLTLVPLTDVDTATRNAKDSVIAVGTANEATLTGLEVTIDGVDLDAAGMRVALIGQTDAKENGIWVVQTGAWTRPADFAVGYNAGGSYFRVMQGTLGAGKGYICSNYGSDVVGTNNLTFVAMTDVDTATRNAKDSVLAVATANQATLTGLEVTIDGVALDAVGMRVGLVGQTTATENGIWVVQSSAWTRPTDFAVGYNAGGSYFFVKQGTVGAGKGYICSNQGSDVVGTNNLTFVALTA